MEHQMEHVERGTCVQSRMLGEEMGKKGAEGSSSQVTSLHYPNQEILLSTFLNSPLLCLLAFQVSSTAAAAALPRQWRRGN